MALRSRGHRRCSPAATAPRSSFCIDFLRARDVNEEAATTPGDRGSRRGIDHIAGDHLDLNSVAFQRGSSWQSTSRSIVTDRTIINANLIPHRSVSQDRPIECDKNPRSLHRICAAWSLHGWQFCLILHGENCQIFRWIAIEVEVWTVRKWTAEVQRDHDWRGIARSTGCWSARDSTWSRSAPSPSRFPLLLDLNEPEEKRAVFLSLLPYAVLLPRGSASSGRMCGYRFCRFPQEHRTTTMLFPAQCCEEIVPSPARDRLRIRTPCWTGLPASLRAEDWYQGYFNPDPADLDANESPGSFE